MQRWWQTAALILVAAAFSACGTTIGDPCTVPDDCGGQICLNQKGTPGGYCSKTCSVTDPDSCPSGSVCIPDGAGDTLPACFLECGSHSDCRPGYQCNRVADSLATVCIGPEGL